LIVRTLNFIRFHGWGLALAGILLLWSAPSWAESADPTDLGPPLDEIELEFLHLLNEYREANGLDCLVPSPTMNTAADYMSRFMGEEGFFSHQEPPCDESGDNCTGRDPFERIAAFGHTGFSLAGENISAGTLSAIAALEGWQSSPGHNENMLRDGFRSIGIGRVEVPNSPFGVYWTTDFSDFIDGGGNCSEEGANDYPPVEGSGEDDELKIEGVGCWTAVLPHPLLFLVLVWGCGVARRRIGQDAP